MSNPKPAWPAHCDDGAWYCDAHGTYGCERCGSETPPTARELLTLLGMEDTVETLAARVEAVLSLIDSRWQVPAEVIVAQIRRILDGEKP